MTHVLATFNLNDLDNQPKSTLYNLLAPLHKEVFEEGECIIFKCPKELKHSYNDLPADILINLQKMLVYIDIPNFFCTIISTIDLSLELDYVCKHYAVNETPIKNIVETFDV